MLSSANTVAEWRSSELVERMGATRTTLIAYTGPLTIYVLWFRLTAKESKGSGKQASQ